MRLVTLTSALALFATGAFAGETAYSSQSEPMVSGAAAMGDTAAWLIPLIAIALIVLASGSCRYRKGPATFVRLGYNSCWD